MTRWFAKWNATDLLHSLPTPERVKTTFTLLQMAKADMDSGAAKDWQTGAGWNDGFMIFEGSETDVSAAILKYSPYIRFEVTPMISLAQAIEIGKKVAETKM